MRELFYIFKIDKSQILNQDDATKYYQEKFNNIKFKDELKKSINTLFPSKKSHIFTIIFILFIFTFANIMLDNHSFIIGLLIIFSMFLMFLLSTYVYTLSLKEDLKSAIKRDKIILNDLDQLNTLFVSKDDEFKIRYLHELIKENKDIRFERFQGKQNNEDIIVVYVNNNYELFKNEYYEDKELQLLEKYNNYSLDTNTQLFNFYNHTFKPIINKIIPEIVENFKVQSNISELERKIKKSAKRE